MNFHIPYVITLRSSQRSFEFVIGPIPLAFIAFAILYFLFL